MNDTMIVDDDSWKSNERASFNHHWLSIAFHEGSLLAIIIRLSLNTRVANPGELHQGKEFSHEEKKNILSNRYVLS